MYRKNSSSILDKSKISKTVLKNIKELLIEYFNFQWWGYQQINGLWMGSPLAPLLANVFVSDLETGLLEKHQKPKNYWRYVDVFISNKN